MPRSTKKGPIPVETVPDDATLLQQYGRATRALLARLQPLVGQVDELDTLRTVQKRAQLRLEQIEGEKGAGS